MGFWKSSHASTFEIQAPEFMRHLGGAMVAPPLAPGQARPPMGKRSATEAPRELRYSLIGVKL